MNLDIQIPDPQVRVVAGEGPGDDHGFEEQR
jgi:hypothetical protein